MVLSWKSWAVRAVAPTVLLGGVVAWAAQKPGASNAPAAVPATAAVSTATSVSAGKEVPTKSTASSGEATTGSGTTATISPAMAALAAQRQMLLAAPLLARSNLDIAARGKGILAHLNAALRFYRGAVAPIQKVGEPSDVLYGEQAATEAIQIAQFAFTAAKSEAAILERVNPKPGTAAPVGQGTASEPSETQRLQSATLQVAQRLEELQAQDAALDKEILTAKAKDLPALRAQDEQVEGQLELQKAISGAVGRLSSSTDAGNRKGLAGDIERLEASAPELTTNTKRVPPPLLENLTAAREAGVTSQATALFQLLSTRHAIEGQIRATDALRAQATELRAPLLSLLRTTIQQGQAAEQAPLAPAENGAAASVAAAADAPPTAAEIRKRFDTLTATFQVISNAMLPLSQELMLLESERATLSTWDTAVESEYKLVLRDLLLRVAEIAIALGLIFLLNAVWGRATVRYVKDLRRRRQLLVVRRAVVGFLGGLVVIFGFISQVSSLATFAGFISAGIAVGLQTILLSVAAYFFIVGRYGVRVGDRITVAGVTGDVVEVGLVRFYMLELVGTGTELHPTGRVAVFANSVLFQTGTPLYKQLPGTEYAWHELTAKLNEGSDFKPATDAVLLSVGQVYETYRGKIEDQQKQVENWMGAPLAAPQVESRLQLADTGLQFIVLFPVEIGNANEVDQQITRRLLEAIGKDPQVKGALAGPPVIKAAIKS